MFCLVAKTDGCAVMNVLYVNTFQTANKSMRLGLQTWNCSKYHSPFVSIFVYFLKQRRKSWGSTNFFTNSLSFNRFLFGVIYFIIVNAIVYTQHNIFNFSECP